MGGRCIIIRSSEGDFQAARRATPATVHLCRRRLVMVISLVQNDIVPTVIAVQTCTTCYFLLHAGGGQTFFRSHLFSIIRGFCAHVGQALAKRHKICRSSHFRSFLVQIPQQLLACSKTTNTPSHRLFPTMLALFAYFERLLMPQVFHSLLKVGLD